jgi:hypothetical protein
VFSEALGETIIETVEGACAIGQFSVDELGRLLRGETLESKRALLIVGSFIGQEAARVMLNEKTETSRFIHALAAEFDSLDTRDKNKAISKIALAIFLPSLGFKVVNQSGKMMVRKVASTIKKPVKAAEASVKSVKKTEVLLGKNKRLTPQYQLSSETKIDRLAQTELTKPATSRYVFNKAGLTKLEVRELLRANKLGLPDIQVKETLKCLKDGRATSVNFKLDKVGNIKLSMERPGHTSGFQRMSYKIEPNGNKAYVVQTAFDEQLNLVRQRGTEGKNILFDVKKPRNIK